jgi:hypothetical protein
MKKKYPIPTLRLRWGKQYQLLSRANDQGDHTHKNERSTIGAEDEGEGIAGGEIKHG